MMKNFRLVALLTLITTPLPALAAPIHAILYKNPQCTCCEIYAAYLKSNGFDVELKPTNDLEEISAKAGTPADLEGATRCSSTATPSTGSFRRM